jgi:hypothetical protein
MPSVGLEVVPIDPSGILLWPHWPELSPQANEVACCVKEWAQNAFCSRKCTAGGGGAVGRGRPDAAVLGEVGQQAIHLGVVRPAANDPALPFVRDQVGSAQDVEVVGQRGPRKTVGSARPSIPGLD